MAVVRTLLPIPGKKNPGHSTGSRTLYRGRRALTSTLAPRRPALFTPRPYAADANCSGDLTDWRGRASVPASTAIYNATTSGPKVQDPQAKSAKPRRANGFSFMARDHAAKSWSLPALSQVSKQLSKARDPRRAA